MKDIQNTKGDFKYKINKVGINNVLHPVTIKTKDGKLVSTVGKFTMAVSLKSELKGINMKHSKRWHWVPKGTKSQHLHRPLYSSL